MIRLIAGVLLAAALAPLLRRALKRCAAASRLRRACRSEGHRLEPLRPFWFWAPNLSDRADFLVRMRGGRAVYTVKLFGAPCRLSNIYFIRKAEGGTACFTRRVIPLAGRFASMLNDDLRPIDGQLAGGINYTRDSAPRTRPPVDYFSPTGGEGIVNIPVLLFTPAPLNVRASEEVPLEHMTVERLPMFTKKESTRLESKTLFDGDLLHGCEYVFGVQGFLAELKNLKLPREYGLTVDKAGKS